MNVQQLEQELPPILLYAVPILVLALLIEWLIIRFHPEKAYDADDFRASLGIGIGSLIINAFMKSFILALGIFFYELVPWRMPSTWYTWVLTLVIIDFCNYLAHFTAHKQRVWWATHVTHHSSEHLNLSTAFRNSWTQHLKLVFFIPAWLTGADPVIAFSCYQLDLLHQFWIHTEVITKMPRWFEFIFVTPSHHRVHHGSNDAYLDKNFGSMFIIWDRLFGTFQEETETPKYGLTKPVDSQNVVYLNFHEWRDIWHDLRKTRSLKGAMKVLFGPPV
ncbi:sterol desaturase family protein [Nibrella saemangeumensis]|uniref:Sterol desaturase family protein n=1 Tax=Nibrella saemangeumensis TaxID=1084526 RepID=A0ABP8NLS5_9BACT